MLDFKTISTSGDVCVQVGYEDGDAVMVYITQGDDAIEMTIEQYGALFSQMQEAACRKE